MAERKPATRPATPRKRGQRRFPIDDEMIATAQSKIGLDPDARVSFRVADASKPRQQPKSGRSPSTWTRQSW